MARDDRTASVRIRGTAEQLLLTVWGRVPVSTESGVELSGDVALVDQWSVLVPPM